MEEKIYKKKKETAWRRIGGETVIMDLDGMMIRGLNETAAFIWDQIDGQKKIIEIAELVSREFAINPEKALDDVIKFSAILTEKGLIGDN